MGRRSMLFSLIYLLVRRVLGAARRPQDERDIEILVLRHQVKVLRRQVKRPRLHRLDRVLLAAASRAMPRDLWSSFVVGPETLVRWHRELVRKKRGHIRGEGAPGGHRWTPRPGTSSSASPRRTLGGVTSGSGESC